MFNCLGETQERDLDKIEAMHGIIGSIGLLILAAGIAAGGVSLVTSYWRVRPSFLRRLAMPVSSNVRDLAKF